MAEILLRERVKKVMDEKGITVADLARKTTIPAGRIYKWFKDNLNPKGTDSLILEQWLKKLEEVPRETIVEEPNKSVDKLIESNSVLAKTNAKLVNLLIERFAAMDTKTMGLAPKGSIGRKTNLPDSVQNKTGSEAGSS